MNHSGDQPSARRQAKERPKQCAKQSVSATNATTIAAMCPAHVVSVSASLLRPLLRLDDVRLLLIKLDIISNNLLLETRSDVLTLLLPLSFWLLK